MNKEQIEKAANNYIECLLEDVTDKCRTLQKNVLITNTTTKANIKYEENNNHSDSHCVHCCNGFV